MKDKSGCVVCEHNGSFFTDFRFGSSVLTFSEELLKIRGTFTSDIYISLIMWYAVPQKPYYKNHDIILNYIENGKEYCYRLQISKKIHSKTIELLRDNHIKDMTGKVSEW